jgi:hypothetical protein
VTELSGSIVDLAQRVERPVERLQQRVAETNVESVAALLE